MLILDKRRAVEHMVALAARSEVSAETDDPPAPSRRRSYARVATYERRTAMVAAREQQPRRAPLPQLRPAAQ